MLLVGQSSCYRDLLLQWVLLSICCCDLVDEQVSEDAADWESVSLVVVEAEWE